MASGARSFRESYDIAVIGAGPAGLNAASTILTAAPQTGVLLIDKTVPWDIPIACAEAVGRQGFHEACKVEKGWIRFNISKAAFHSPDGTSVTYTDSNKGYIINRTRMQRDMADMCRKKGVDCQFNVRVQKVGHLKQGARSLSFSNGETTQAKIVVDASGPLSTFGKGEKISWKSLDLEPAYF
ncbi:MAG: hypothetical protein GF398_17220, partial [Chitinivibrionales bacterium]|nr:hypothetical protein [Chitinivibrionales bacterium]